MRVQRHYTVDQVSECYCTDIDLVSYLSRCYSIAPMKGNHYDNIFIHFQPVQGWDYDWL